MLTRIARRSYSSASPAVKLVSRDAPGNLSKVSVVVENAGAKVGKSGIAHLLSKFNFLNNEVKSGLRFTRESELLGGDFNSVVTRDAITLNTVFLREDLPYYIEALGNVLAKTSFRPHELKENVLPVAKAEYQAAIKSNTFVGLESLHQLTFRKGLGNALYYDGTTPVTVEEVQQFAKSVYTASNIKIIASGVNAEDLSSFVSESAFSELPAGTSTATPVKVFEGKESRISAAGESVALIGVPVQKADFAKYEILSTAAGTSYLPGAVTPLSAIPGASSQLLKYADAGLFVVSVSGDAASVATGIKAAKKAVDSVSASDLKKAVKATKLSIALQDAEISVDEAAAKSAVKLPGFNYVAVGNIDVLPYIDEL